MRKTGPRWRVRFRRKREGKTDYRKRLRLLRSGKPRLVVRVSLKHVVAQVIRTASMGDITLASAHSKELEKIGWRGDTSNTPTAYLIGLLCGYRALKAGINECILDIGMHDPAPKARVFAVTKGALDTGLYIPLDKGVLPDDRRVRGEHIADYAAELKKEREEIYRIRFSAYLRKGLQPELLPSHFDKIRSRIIQSHR